jgi:LuxR family maltose regulon positive regulatory protein
VDGAARWTKENGLRAEDEPRYASEPDHLVLARVLLAQGRPGQALALLDRLIVAQRADHIAEIPPACLARLQRAFNAANPTPGPRSGATAAAPGIVEPLTCRELEVLGMLGRASRTRPSPASSSSPGHGEEARQHVLSKLGAANRTEAVSRARQLDLIP